MYLLVGVQGQVAEPERRGLRGLRAGGFGDYFFAWGSLAFGAGDICWPSHGGVLLAGGRSLETLSTPTSQLLSRMPFLQEELLQRGLVAGSFDFAAYYVIDKIVPRTALPQGTSEVRFSLGAVNRYTPSGGNANPGSAGSGSDDAVDVGGIGLPAIADGTPPAPAQHPQPKGRALKRYLSLEIGAEADTAESQACIVFSLHGPCPTHTDPPLN